jgi:hypothetical protein
VGIDGRICEMFVIYNTVPAWYDNSSDETHVGIIAITGDYTSWDNRPSDSEWLIPGTYND